MSFTAFLRQTGAEKIPASFIDGTAHEIISLGDLGMMDTIAGGMPQGYNVEADVLTRTADGRDLNDLWAEYQQVVAIHNERRNRLVNLLTFPVTNVIEDVPQMGGDDFEEASEFGIPKAVRVQLNSFSLAYDFKWYDIRKAFTWKYLAEADQRQTDAIHQSVLEADNRLVFKKVMQTIFRNTNRSATITGNNYTVYALYNADGTVPPDYKSNTFDGTHTHYVTSGAATIDSGDMETLFLKLREHGYGETNGTTMIVFANSAQTPAIRTWRAGVTNANAAVALYDFIPAIGSPTFITPNAQGLVGTQPPGTYQGMTVIGSYGPALIVEEDYIPAGYVVIVGTGGDGNLNNPVGIREHANQQLRGLRLMPGNQANYPLIDSFYGRGFGTGIRQRGGAAVMQIVNGAYAIPAAYV